MLKICIIILLSKVTWKMEIGTYMQNLRSNVCYGLHTEEELIQKRKEELQEANNIRKDYEQKLERANDLYIELLNCYKVLENSKLQSCRLVVLFSHVVLIWQDFL